MTERNGELPQRQRAVEVVAAPALENMALDVHPATELAS